ncbi:hypothetical protein ACOMD2_01390 [Hominicoprocola fusiformis]
MNNESNPLADMIKEIAPAILSGILILGKIIPSMREKNPELKAQMEKQAVKDIDDTLGKLAEMEQRCYEKVNREKTQH